MNPSTGLKVYLAPGATDLRKSIDGLSLLAAEVLELDPLSGHLFVFCNRKRNLIKILYWERNGFCLWMKRLERERFRWPSGGQTACVDRRSLDWLLDGLDTSKVRAHKPLEYRAVN